MMARFGLLPAFAVMLLAGSTVCHSEEMSAGAARLREDVRILAADGMEGRGVGTEGLRLAGEYIAEQFRLAGLNVTADGGDPYQDFTIPQGAQLGPATALSLLNPAGAPLPDLKIDQQFRPCSFGGTGKFSGGLAFVGYGIQDTQSGYDDFAGIDVRGKVVIVLRRTPFQTEIQGPFAVNRGTSRHASLTTKIGRAVAQGAAAVLLVNDPHTVRQAADNLRRQREQPQPPADPAAPARPEIPALEAADELFEFGYGGVRNGRSIPCLQLRQSVCDQILNAALGKNLTDLEREIDTTHKPFSRDLPGWRATGETSIQLRSAPVRNVIAVREGQGPLGEETVVIGAHFDHLGRGGEGSLAPTSREIHNGADDNASGTAGLLELARRLGAEQLPNRRRVVLIAFAGEERGLLGSKYYIEHPLFPLDRTVAMINLDMIGRMVDGRLTIFGAETSPLWDGFLEAANGRAGLVLNRQPEGFGPSDHSNFYGQRMPVLHFFTGTHSDYHRPTDDWEKINVRDMDRIITLLEGVVRQIATAPERPGYVAIRGSAVLERAGNRPYFGSVPDFNFAGTGYALRDVTPGSPAAQGGLLSGDVIVKFGDKTVGHLADFDRALQNSRPGQSVAITVLRGMEEKTLQVSLGKEQ